MRITWIPTGLAVCLLFVSGAPVLAHGWVGPSIIVPPPPPTKGGQQSGAGGTTQNPVGTTPQTYNGPAGRATQSGAPGATPGTGTTPGPVPVTPGTTPAPEPAPLPTPGGTTPTARPTNPGPRAGAGRATPRLRRKARIMPWMTRIKVPWKAAFLPTNENGMYQGETVSVSRALQMDPATGGWVKEDLPSIVLTYDPSTKAGQRALKSLELDPRFVSASNLFNCFRIDSRSIPGKTSGATLSAYKHDGTFIAQVKGTDRLKGGYSLLRAGFRQETGKPLDKSLPRLQRALNGIAQAEYTLEEIRKTAVDPASGTVRAMAVKTMKRIAARLADWKTALSQMKEVSD